jgi:hypothetical protein
MMTFMTLSYIAQFSQKCTANTVDMFDCRHNHLFEHMSFFFLIIASKL